MCNSIPSFAVTKVPKMQNPKAPYASISRKKRWNKFYISKLGQRITIDGVTYRRMLDDYETFKTNDKDEPIYVVETV